MLSKHKASASASGDVELFFGESNLPVFTITCQTINRREVVLKVVILAGWWLVFPSGLSSADYIIYIRVCNY